MNKIKEQCGDCKAWGGTDCTRNPYTQGCLKDEKKLIECHGMLKGCDMVKQAVKDTAKDIYKGIGKDDILVVETQEYGEIEVVPLERLQEIIKSKGVGVE